MLLMWPQIEQRFPTLARMARDILCIPAASTGCERDFSIARHQMRYNRSYKADTFSEIMQARCRLRDEAVDRLASEAAIAELFTDSKESNDRDPVLEEQEFNKTLIDGITRMDGISDDEGESTGRLIASNLPLKERRSTKLRNEKKRQREEFDNETDGLLANGQLPRPRKSRTRNDRSFR